jgi:hypothetical protein
MSADLYDAILGLIQQATGNNNNNWGTTFNTSFAAPAVRAMAGVNSISTTGGTLDLSTITPPTGLRADIDKIQLITGALVADFTITVTNKSKTWKFWNNTTGAFFVYVKVPGGVARASASAPGGLVQIPQGCLVEVICDGSGTLIRADDVEIGQIVMSTKAAAGPGELALGGASLLRSAYPDLFGKQGTTWGSADGTHFTLPNLLDTNRFPRAGGGSGPAVGTYQANQNLAHSHTITGAPTVGSLSIDSGGSHTHSASSSDGGHSHSVGGAVQQGLNAGSFSAANGLTNPGSTGTGFASITTTVNAGGAHIHTISGAPAAGTLGTASSGGTEARPESAAVLMCVRY